MVISCAKEGIEISGIRYCMTSVTVRAASVDVIGWFASGLCAIVTRRTSTRNSRGPVGIHNSSESRVVTGISLGMALIARYRGRDMVWRLTFGCHAMACVTGSRDNS